MYTLLIKEWMTEHLSHFFSEDSDIITLYRAKNDLLQKETKNEDDYRNLVQSYGFRYDKFIVFKSNLQEVVDSKFPGKKLIDIINEIPNFVDKNKGISTIIDDCIEYLKIYYSYWDKIHSIRFESVEGVGGFESSPSLIFKGSKYLYNYGNQNSTLVKISKIPGWNGITIHFRCYCFIITQKDSRYKMNEGYLIHKKSKETTKAIMSIEIREIALNPWFNVLLQTYFENDELKVKKFKEKIEMNNNSSRHFRRGSNNGDNDKFKFNYFNYSNVGGRVFLSFISKDSEVIE